MLLFWCSLDRLQTVLPKYDRIDPSEVQALKDEIVKLKAESEEKLKEKDAEVAAQKARVCNFSDICLIIHLMHTFRLKLWKAIFAHIEKLSPRAIKALGQNWEK